MTLISRFAVLSFLLLLLSGCTTEPFTKPLIGFAQGLASARDALVELDRRNTEALQLSEMARSRDWSVGPCEISSPCPLIGVPEVKSRVPDVLLGMAKVVTYVNGLVELSTAKDAAAISAAVGKINAAASATLKTFGPAVRDGPIWIASFDLITTIADEFIAYQRLQELKKVMKRNRWLIGKTMDDLGSAAENLRLAILKHEADYLRVQDRARATATFAEKMEIERRLVRARLDWNRLQDAKASAPFAEMKKSHEAIVKALDTEDPSATAVAGKIIKFLEKARALEDAAKKSGS